MSATLSAVAPIRRIVYTIGDIDHIWRRCAVQAEPGVWIWDVGDLDRVFIEFARDRGRMVTTWERRDDDVVFLLVKNVQRPRLRVV